MRMLKEEKLDLSIIMPCRNEENAVAKAIQDAKAFLDKYGISGEILVVDNASTDKSASVARKNGARVVYESLKGYGRAIRTGIAESEGRVLIIGDADTTYDFRRIGRMYKMLKSGRYDVVIGDRFAVPMEKGAMSMLHVVGVKFLSMFGRLRYHVKVRDFHCGLRGVTRNSAEKMKLKCDGMEFATELIGEASELGLTIGETPVRLRRSRCDRKSKLRTFPDGLRHLKYMFFSGLKA